MLCQKSDDRCWVIGKVGEAIHKSDTYFQMQIISSTSLETKGAEGTLLAILPIAKCFSVVNQNQTAKQF